MNWSIQRKKGGGEMATVAYLNTQHLDCVSVHLINVSPVTLLHLTGVSQVS